MMTVTTRGVSVRSWQKCEDEHRTMKTGRDARVGSNSGDPTAIGCRGRCVHMAHSGYAKMNHNESHIRCNARNYRYSDGMNSMYKPSPTLFLLSRVFLVSSPTFSTVSFSPIISSVVPLFSEWYILFTSLGTCVSIANPPHWYVHASSPFIGT